MTNLDRKVENASEAKAMEMIKTSGVLNPDITLDRVMELTQQIAELDPGQVELHSDKFIHKHFIFRHQD